MVRNDKSYVLPTLSKHTFIAHLKKESMFRFIFLCIIIVHGLIHLLGLVKAFEWVEIKTLIQPISKLAGVIWLLAFFLFCAFAVCYFFKHQNWWLIGFVAVVISQALILNFWQDAKIGTLANVILLLVLIPEFGSWKFEHRYKQEVEPGIERHDEREIPLLLEKDIQHLPVPVQKYLRYVGVINKPKVHYVKIVFEGEMRERGKDWFPFTSEQYNFFDNPERFFFMKAKVNGLASAGYHVYKKGRASMQIKVLSLFPVVEQTGKKMNQAETVTFFNDMCVFAPATLIDASIQWDTIDDTSVKATFTKEGISISANLYFNSHGQLINFVSFDRYEITEMKRLKFSTPLSRYKDYNGFNLCSYGEAVWHYPDRDFTYGKFQIKSVSYNASPL